MAVLGLTTSELNSQLNHESNPEIRHPIQQSLKMIDRLLCQVQLKLRLSLLIHGAVRDVWGNFVHLKHYQVQKQV
jgi:hypothetical protein